MIDDSILMDSIPSELFERSVNNIRLIAELPEKTFLEHLFSFSTLIIAIANAFLVYYIFRKNSTKDYDNNEKNRKINLLKTLVLDYNMDKLYSFYQEVCKNTESLKTKNISEKDKCSINEKIKDLATNHRQNFIDLFLGIESSLYDKMISQMDKLIDGLTETIFDEGINLSHEPKFEECITKVIKENKTGVIKILFSYSGE